MKQIVQAVKGTRDFYPEEMAFRRWFYAKIQQVSERFGYQEFDGPIIEYIDLYSDKTSEEILKDQAFSLQDRDGRTILLRPEITPTFARMVAQKSGSLIKPIRWYSFGRGYRYEQPQKGRGREFFQWDIEVPLKELPPLQPPGLLAPRGPSLPLRDPVRCLRDDPRAACPPDPEPDRGTAEPGFGHG